VDVERGSWSGRSWKMLRGTPNSAPKKEEPAPKFPRSIVFLLFLISVGLGYFFFFIYLKKTKKAQEVRLAHLPPMTIFKTFLVQNKSSARICTMNFPPSQFALSTNLTDRDKLNEIRWLSGRSPHQHNFVCFSTQLANVSAGVPKGLTFES
jgi:hypothetical protein